MSGPQLRLRLRELLPHARVVFLTGYEYEAAGGDVVIEKPVTAAKLVSMVRDLIPAP